MFLCLMKPLLLLTRGAGIYALPARDTNTHSSAIEDFLKQYDA